MDAARLAWLSHPTRSRMLAAAEHHFATEGFDAARVDDIAATAGVAKSHLYYHFAGKADLLAALIELRVGELLAAKERLFAAADAGGILAGAGGVRPDDGDPLAELLRRAVEEVLLPRRDFIRVVLVEAIRNPDAARPVFAALEDAVADTAARFTAAGYAFDERSARLWLHFGVVPTLYLVALEGAPAAPEIAAALSAWERTVIPTLRRNDVAGPAAAG